MKNMAHNPPDDIDKIQSGSTDEDATPEAPAAAGAPANVDNPSPEEPPAVMVDSTPAEDLRRHAEMLCCLVADHPGSGVLVLQGKEADPQRARSESWA